MHPNNSARGGSAVLIKDNIYHYEVLKHEEHEIQSVAVRVNTKHYPITISAIYCPPRHSIKKDQYIDFLEKLGNRFILGGDFNAKNIHWCSRLTTTKGKELLSAVKQINCETVSTGNPTYWPTDQNKLPDLIDFYIYKNIASGFLSIEEGYDMNSDHSPTILTLSESIIEKEDTPRLVNKHTDWESFKIDLNDEIDLNVPLRNSEQLDLEVDMFVKAIQRSAWKNTPEIRSKLKGNNYPKEIRTLLAAKRSQRKNFLKIKSYLIS